MQQWAGRSYEEIRIRHQGDIVGHVIDGTYEVIKGSVKMLEQAQAMETTLLTREEKKIFAESAHAVRYEDSEAGKAINPISLLTPKRYADADKDDLFTIFNVIQENIIKGGVRGQARDNYGFPKRVRSRAIMGIDQI